MKNLMDELVDIIEKHDGNTEIHATGGFKAQIALATLAGILFHQKVYYLYEDFEDVVRLPEIPLDFNYEALLASQGDFFKLLDAREYGKSDEVFNRLPEMLRHCFYKDNILKKYNLTPLGRAMFRAFKRQIGLLEGAIPIEVKGESGLWGEERDSLGKILNPLIGMILERISRFNKFILSFDFFAREIPHSPKKRGIKENYLELIKKTPDTLTYRITHVSSVKGFQDILRIRTSQGMASYLLQLLGRKIYP